MMRQVSFVIRASSIDEGQTFHGQIEHVLTGTTAHFQDLIQLQAFVAGYLQPQPEAGASARPSAGDRVSSMFSFLRRRPEQPAEPAAEPTEAQPAEAPAILLPGEAPVAPGETPVVLLPSGEPAHPSEPAAAPGETPVVLLPSGEPAHPSEPAAAPVALAFDSTPPPIDLDTYLGEMLDLLNAFLPEDVSGLPPNSLSVISLEYRALGLGGRYGMLTSNGVDVAELRGGWLDAVVRFDIWASTPAAANTAITTIQNGLVSNGLALRKKRLLRLKLNAVADGDPGTVSGWRKTLDYSVLYEYRYADTDGAASLIARVPIDSQTDGGPTTHETTSAHDWMSLWDSGAASALIITAPPRRTLRIDGLAIATYLPAGGPAGVVTQQITRASVTETTTFPTLGAFLASFTSNGDPLELVYPPLPLQDGELPGSHVFQVRELRFDPPITLKGGDVFQISFDAAAFPAGNLSQVYLRALGQR